MLWYELRELKKWIFQHLSKMYFLPLSVSHVIQYAQANKSLSSNKHIELLFCLFGLRRLLSSFYTFSWFISWFHGQIVEINKIHNKLFNIKSLCIVIMVMTDHGLMMMKSIQRYTIQHTRTMHLWFVMINCMQFHVLNYIYSIWDLSNFVHSRHSRNNNTICLCEDGIKYLLKLYFSYHRKFHITLIVILCMAYEFYEKNKFFFCSYS